MWELAIVFSNFNCKYIKEIKNELLKECKKSKVVCTILTQEKQTKLLIACEKENKQKVVKVLDEVISELFVTNYKEQYIKNNIQLKSIDQVSFKAFIKALTCFDKDYDKQYVKQKLNYTSTLYLHSFFAFKLKNLKDKWQDICNLTNENSTFLKAQDTFIELLKFLIKNLKIKHKMVNITFKNNTYNFLDENNKRIKLKDKTEETDETFLITNLITLNPQTINLYCGNSIEVETLSLLSKLFGSKINVCKK